MGEKMSLEVSYFVHFLCLRDKSLDSISFIIQATTWGKPVLGVSDQVRHKRLCSHSRWEEAWNFGLRKRFSKKQKQRCWSALLLLWYSLRHVFPLRRLNILILLVLSGSKNFKNHKIHHTICINLLSDLKATRKSVISVFLCGSFVSIDPQPYMCTTGKGITMNL